VVRRRGGEPGNRPGLVADVVVPYDVDAHQLPAYLETPNPRNITFYERHGFEVTGRAIAGEFPPVTFMMRRAHD
jgi:hypothetical protein